VLAVEDYHEMSEKRNRKRRITLVLQGCRVCEAKTGFDWREIVGVEPDPLNKDPGQSLASLDPEKSRFQVFCPDTFGRFLSGLTLG
jgi:hypothetical protein